MLFDLKYESCDVRDTFNRTYKIVGNQMTRFRIEAKHRYVNCIHLVQSDHIIPKQITVNGIHHILSTSQSTNQPTNEPTN